MLTFEQIRELVRQALQAALNLNPDSWLYIVDLFEDAVVYEIEGPAGDKGPLYQKRSYSIEDGKAQLGQPQAVEKKIEYIPLQAASQLLAAAGDPGDDDYGFKWRVRVVEYGMGKDGRINWPKEPLVAALDLYENAKVFCLNESQHQAANKPFGKSVREVVGWLKAPVDTGTAIEADLYILKSAKWLRDALVDSHDRGNPDLLGLSHDVSAKAVTKMGAAGKRYKEPVEITAVQVDVVYDPTNNGKFIRMAAAVGQEGDTEMFVKLLAALKSKQPDLHTKITAGMADGSITEEQAISMVAAATVKDAGGDDNNEKLVASVVDGIKGLIAEAGTNQQADDSVLQEMKLLAAGITLDRELTESKLPLIAQDNLRKRFVGQQFQVEDLQAAIKDEKVLIDSLTGSGNVDGAGGGRIAILRGAPEKLQAAMDKMLGVKVEEAFADITPLGSLRAAYVEMTGDTEVRGYIEPAAAARLQAAYGSSTFSFVLGNTLYRRLTQDYREQSDFGVSRLVGNNIRNARDFRTMESVRIGYYGDLPDVDPEAADYADLGELGDEEISYVLNQKGGLITITRKMIINDDMRVVQKILSRLPRAARRTLAKRCWTPFINNAVYGGDATAIFHASHANLGAVAYGISSALAAKTAMAQQTEPESGERLMLRPVTVAYPSELFGIVKNVNNFNPQAVDIANGNTMYGFFQPEGMVECPFMTDANDWMMFADPNECEILELAYLNGQQEPEMFIADQAAVGQMFVADKVQYKIRHEYECAVVDYRGSYKAVVA
ncbi:MAG: hypothetical protein L3J57_01670 [Desulfuromusa sp.]|nr:hypothetical protein [Desulfuromusa sp.]